MDKINVKLTEDEIGLILAGFAVYESWLYKIDSHKDLYIRDMLNDIDRIRNLLRFLVYEHIRSE